MKTVILEGFLGDKYGREWNIVARSYADIVNCVEANYPGFRQDLIDYYNNDGGVAILSGKQLLESEEELFYPIREDYIVISPIPEGSKSGGAKVLLGVLLIASFFLPGVGGAILAGSSAIFGFGTVAAATAASVVSLSILGLGVNLALTGLQQLMAPDPSVDTGDDQKYLFNGPENTVASGNPVPILCGEMIIGGIIMSSAVVPGLPSASGHIGGYYPGSGGALPGGSWGAYGGNLGGNIVDPNGTGTGEGFDVIAGAALESPTDDLILYSANTFDKPWVAKSPTIGVSYIAPVVPHEIPAASLTDHYLAVRKQQYTKEIIWDNFTPVTVGTLPANGNLYKVLDNISTNFVADFSGTDTTGNMSATLDNFSLTGQGDVAFVGILDSTFDTIGLSSAGSFTGVGGVSGDLITTLSGVSTLIEGTADFIGDFTYSFEDATVSAVGDAAFIATSEFTLDNSTISSEGTYTAGSSYEAESDALFARFTTDPGTTRKGHINTLIAGLKTDGIWSKLKGLYVFAAHDKQAAYLDWTTDRTAVDVGTGPNFTTDNYISNVASPVANYANSQLDMTLQGIDSASHFGVATKSSSNYRRLVSENGGFLASYITTPDGTFTRTRHKFASFVEHGGSTASAISYICAVDDGTNIVPYRDGTAGTTQTRATGGWFGTWRFLDGGDTTTANNLKLYAFHVGESLTSTEVNNLNSRLATYFTAVGAS